MFSSRVEVRIRFSVWLVGGYAHTFILLSVVMVTYPHKTGVGRPMLGYELVTTRLDRMVCKSGRVVSKRATEVWSSGCYVKQEQLERWRAKRKLASRSKHRGACWNPGISLL